MEAMAPAITLAMSKLKKLFVVRPANTTLKVS